MRKNLLIILLFCTAWGVYSPYAVYAASSADNYKNYNYTSEELLNMTINSLKYDKAIDMAGVRGVGLISRNDIIGIYLARRAALSDAQRGLLILRRSIKEGRIPRAESVSGHVPPVQILNEYTRDSLYFVEVRTSLKELMAAEPQKSKSSKQ